MNSNFHLSEIPKREPKPRKKGITMVMDKGMSLKEIENLIENSGELIDLVKFGFGTSYVSKNLQEKIKLLQKSNIKVYFGGTLFEAFIARNMFEEYLKLLDKYQIETVEVSDGSIKIPHDKKCEYISKLCKNKTVLSEIGSKESNHIIPPFQWIKMIKKEKDAGSWKIIAEAREGGNVGIFRQGGDVRTDLIEEILTSVSEQEILWEAPKKEQQVWFIKNFGTNVNLGNINPQETISLECLRLGLRGDTFNLFLNK